MSILTRLEKQPRIFALCAGLALIGAIGALDYLTGYEYAFSIFYVLPIALITWLTGRRFGFAASLLSAYVYYSADTTAGYLYSNPFILVWNALIRFGFFIIITLLLSALRQALLRAQELARIDPLTGAVNSRFFYQLAQQEIDRLKRYQHAFTVAYLDLDNFKMVNDEYGHLTGDDILRAVVTCALRNMRKTDVVARLGGDEFIWLFPETNEEAARLVVPKIQTCLVKTMQLGNWPVSFSIGVLTCNAAPSSADEMVRMADELMYLVKRNGKNAIRYSSYEG